MGAGLRAMSIGLLLAGPAAAGLTGPAELPPPEYAGQQYVDSKGCLFLRTWSKGKEIWTPRVTRDGVPLCDYPPSGQRVPVADPDDQAETGASP
jgi:predicted small lipoprotein YifL